MVRFEGARGFEFTSNPQVMGQPATVYYEGLRVGTVLPQVSKSRGFRFKVYNNEGLCCSDCGQFGGTFAVLKAIADTQRGAQCRL